MRKNSVGKEVRMESSAVNIRLSRIIATAILSGMVVQVTLTRPQAQTNQSSSQVERSREKAYLRQQFARHFRTIQVESQSLLKTHEDGKLNPRILGKESREINKAARNLRSMIALGALAEEVELKTSFNSAADFDAAIRDLAGIVRKFARNPSHQNSRILNTDQATEAQTDLLSIIRLSKALTEQSGNYR